MDCVYDFIEILQQKLGEWNEIRKNIYKTQYFVEYVEKFLT